MAGRSRGPVVGVVGHGYAVAMHFGDLPVTGTPRWYVDALSATGARTVLLPGPEAVGLLDVVDGLVLTGGGDVDPALSGCDHQEAVDVDRARDEAELALVRVARAAGVPTLGVCRGAQVLAVAFGGRLAGGLEHVRPFEGHHVHTAPGSLVASLVGGSATTSALHRQAVVETGPSWRATAWTSDGTVEAVEWAAGDWSALGVQWHPELAWHTDLHDATGPALFGWLVGAAAARRPRHLVRS